MDIVFVVLKWLIVVVVLIIGVSFLCLKYFGNGIKKYYYKNGSLESEDSRKDFLLHGLCKKYYENGNKWYEKNYEYGQLCGEQISYYENGMIEKKSHRAIVKILKNKKEWRKSVLDGEELIYNEDGKIVCKKIGSFQDSQEIVRTYRADEIVITLNSLEKNEKTQVFFILLNETILDYKDEVFIRKTYHPNNMVNEVERYKIVDIELDRSELDGLQEVYNHWGELLSEKFYRLGKLIKTRIYENGKIQEEKIVMDNNGMEQYIQKYYHINGTLHLLIPRLDGETHGVLKEYSNDGKLHQETIYEKGEAITQRTYFENGNLWRETPDFFDKYGLLRKGSGNGAERMYYENGQIQSIVDRYNRKKHGAEILYRPNGNVWRIVRWLNGNMESIEKYNILGGLSVSFSFKNNKKNGLAISYRRYDWDYIMGDGYKVSEVPYTNGKIDGIVKTYYSDGSVRSEILFENGRKMTNCIRKYEKGEKSKD